ncbi:MAG: methyltransferase domain-containing protein [bacterium]
MDSFLDKFLRRLRFGEVVKHIPKNSIVCDIGCGSDALFLRSISGKIQQGIGLDEKVENYRDAKFEFKKFKVFKDIPLERESCDAVTMIAVLEHLTSLQLVLNESFRILKKGGKLILTTPTPLAKPILDFFAFKLRLIDEGEIRDHKNYFWPKDIKKMLKESGFTEEDIRSKYFEFFLNSLIIAKK